MKRFEWAVNATTAGGGGEFGGGGGGSSYAGTGTSTVVHTGAYNTGDGMIRITFN